MKLLLDSHAFIWMMLAPEHLGRDAKELLSDNANQLFLSSVSLWELVIKESLKKLAVPKGVLGLLKISQQKALISLLQIEPEHLRQLSRLPFHHRDPFDRLLIAQALIEDLALVTKDPEYRPYKVKVFW